MGWPDGHDMDWQILKSVPLAHRSEGIKTSKVSCTVIRRNFLYRGVMNGEITVQWTIKFCLPPLRHNVPVRPCEMPAYRSPQITSPHLPCFVCAVTINIINSQQHIPPAFSVTVKGKYTTCIFFLQKHEWQDCLQESRRWHPDRMSTASQTWFPFPGNLMGWESWWVSTCGANIQCIIWVTTYSSDLHRQRKSYHKCHWCYSHH